MKKSYKLLTLLLAVVLLVGLMPTAFAAQDSSYHDPAEHWVRASNRTSELDSNAIVTRETFYCSVCDKQTSFAVFRTPEYTRDGVSAMTRNVFFSDGANLNGEIVSRIYDGVPGVDATYTNNHWTKAVCETCGTTNSNAYSEYGINKDLYVLSDCALNFMIDLDDVVTYKSVDSQTHTKTVKGGQYCVFCFGTNHTEETSRERHSLTTTVTAEAGNHRFKAVESCPDCGYDHTGYKAAKVVVASYYGVADGAAHTLTVTDLSDAGVATSIRYGTTANNCNLASAPNYTDEGQYTVYYEITYTLGGEDMTENGVAYVQLRADQPNDPPADLLGCTAHKYTLVSTVAPTCNGLGYERYLCTVCGTAENRNYTAALDHSWQDVTVREASCGVSGKVAQICTRCGLVHAIETPAGNHSYNLFSVPATCTSSGYEAEVCGVCGDTHILATLNATAHNYIATTTPATCVTSGRTTYRCSTCGDSYTDNYSDPLGHIWDLGTAITAPTCTTDGVMEYRCTRCNVTSLKPIPATGHTPGAIATCTTDQLCTVCSAVLERATGHSYVESDICGQPDTCSKCGGTADLNATLSSVGVHNYIATTTPATCTTAGRTTYRCNHCGDSYTDNYTEALGHTWDTGSTVTAPTCTAQGMKEYRCSRCGVTTLEAIPATGHNYQETITPASCEVPGEITRCCVSCGDSSTSVYADALGHAWDSGKAVTVPNCTGDGVTEYHCTRCAAHYMEASTAAGHTPGPAADCTHAQVCAKCGVVLAGATGHNYEKAVIPATCTEGGKTIFACTGCDSVYELEPTQPTGHDWDAGTVVTASTCTGEGVMEYNCQRCDAHYLEAESVTGHHPGSSATCTQPQTCLDCGAVLTKATGHSYTATATKPTCVAMGYTTHTCSRCRDSYKDSYIPALEHTAGAWVVDREATVSREGQRHKNCTLCGKRVESETIPKLETTAITDSRGQATVGGYLASVKDTDTKRPISQAVVWLEGNNLYVTLPKGRELVYADQITVTVQRTTDNSYIRNMSVTASDQGGHSETARTDRYGQVTVPSEAETEYHGAYIVGIPGGRADPSGTMTRAEAAAIFARLLSEKNGDRITPSSTRFSDVPANAWYSGYVRYLDYCGVVNGCPGGVFKPDAYISRSEFTVMAARFYAAMGGEDKDFNANFSLNFWDVSTDYWASDYIWQAAGHGWVLGDGTGAFRGEDQITRAEAVTMVNRLLGRQADQDYIDNNARKLNRFNDLSRGHWAYYDFMEAANSHTAILNSSKEGWQ